MTVYKYYNFRHDGDKEDIKLLLSKDELKEWLQKNPEYFIFPPLYTEKEEDKKRKIIKNVYRGSNRTNIKHDSNMKFLLDSINRNNKHNNMQY